MGKNKILLVIASLLLLGLLSTRAQAGENYNSSKSNTATAVAPLPQNVVENIRREIDRVGVGITEQEVKSILSTLRIKTINHIWIQRKGDTVEVLLGEGPGDLAAARKHLESLDKKGPIKPGRTEYMKYKSRESVDEKKPITPGRTK